MGIDIGRLGYLGLAIETVAGTPEASPTIYLPFAEVPTLAEKHEVLPVEHGVASRYGDVDSVAGKKWSEGDVVVYADAVGLGYLLKMAFGNELLTTGTPNSHNFYTTTSGNTPRTATLWVARGATDVQQIPYACIDELELSVEDDLAKVKCSVMGMAPDVVAAQSPVTTSGTIFSFANYTAKFAATVPLAEAASVTRPKKLTLSVANGIEPIWGAGQNEPVAFRTKQFKASGDYELYFDSTGDRDRYMALAKQALVVTFTGNANEDLKFRIAKLRLDDWSVDSGLDDFYVAGAKFVCELKSTELPNVIDAILRNDKGTVY